jgi:transposase
VKNVCRTTIPSRTRFLLPLAESMASVFCVPRKLRRYRRRWKIERTFSWLQNFRRLLVRHDRLITVYRGFFYLACLMITLRHL